MKLLVIFSSTLRGGGEEYTLTIASAAASRGWEVHAAFPQTNGTASLIEDFTARGVHYHPLEIAETYCQGLAQARKRLLRLARTVSLLLRVKPDVALVNLPWPNHCFSSILACGILQLPSLVVFHLIPHRFPFSQRKLKAYAWARARNQQWLTISEYNRQLVGESFQVSRDKVLRIYNGTDVNSAALCYTPEEIVKLRQRVRQEIGLPQTSRIALTVGRLHPQKGYKDLIHAIPYIVRNFPDVKFVWVGDGQQREDLVNQVREYEIEERVIFLGYRSDVPDLMKAADLFVFPTHYEGHPLALLEAMAHSLPIVSSNASGIREVIEDRVHGLLFRVGDPCNLLEVLSWALEHPEDMQQMAKNALLRVHDFSEERMSDQTLAVLQRLTHPQPQGAIALEA